MAGVAAEGASTRDPSLVFFPLQIAVALRGCTVCVRGAELIRRGNSWLRSFDRRTIGVRGAMLNRRVKSWIESFCHELNHLETASRRLDG